MKIEKERGGRFVKKKRKVLTATKTIVNLVKKKVKGNGEGKCEHCKLNASGCERR